MIVSGWTMDLYCETGNPRHDWYEYHGMSSASFGGISQADCSAQARAAGWTINWQSREARCPLCRNYKPQEDTRHE